MNSSVQAKNGFKTFIITFSISILVFSVVYYVVSEASFESVSVEHAGAGVTSAVNVPSADALASANVPEQQAAVAGISAVNETEVMVDEEVSTFGGMLADKPAVQSQFVLAGGTSGTTGSTVPDTGTPGMTISLIVSLGLIAFVVYYFFMNPQRYLKAKFEKEVLRD